MDNEYYYIADTDGSIIFYDKRAFKVIDNADIRLDYFTIIHKMNDMVTIAVYEDKYSYLTFDGILHKSEYQRSYLDNNLNYINKL